MAKSALVTTGVVAFSNITQHDSYKGKSTGKYNVTITMSDAEAQKLSDMGVTVKEYTKDDGTVLKQRKYSTQYHVPVVDLDNETWAGEVPFGSEVRVAWIPSDDVDPDYGRATYLHKVRLVKAAEGFVEDPEEF